MAELGDEGIHFFSMTDATIRLNSSPAPISAGRLIDLVDKQMLVCRGARAAHAVRFEVGPASNAQQGRAWTWRRAQRPGLLVLDLRPAQDIAATGYLSGARPVAEFDPAALAEHSIVVVYAETVVAALRQRWNLSGVLRLQGGMSAWQEQVMFPQIRADAPRECAPSSTPEPGSAATSAAGRECSIRAPSLRRRVAGEAVEPES